MTRPLTSILNSVLPLMTPSPSISRYLLWPCDPKDPVRCDTSDSSEPKIYCGGLSALCQAVHQLFHKSGRVIYSSSGSSLNQSTLHLSSDPTTFITSTIDPLSSRNEKTLHELMPHLRSSITFHEHLDKLVYNKMGLPTFINSGRVVYTINSRQFAERRKEMQAFNIPDDIFDDIDYRKNTLLAEERGILPLLQKDGGYLLPTASSHIIAFLEETFPERFSYVKEPISKLGSQSFVSPSGRLRAVGADNTPLWKDQPTPEICTYWKGTIPRSLWEGRQMLSDDLIPLQSTGGLFFTPFEVAIEEELVLVKMQINCNDFKVDELCPLPPQLIMKHELEKYFIGTWKMYGSHTTWHDTTPPSQIPEDLHPHWFNLSVLENSLSGARLQESL